MTTRSMMKRKPARRAQFAAVGVALSLVVSACGNSDDSATPTTTTRYGGPQDTVLVTPPDTTVRYQSTPGGDDLVEPTEDPGRSVASTAAPGGVAEFRTDGDAIAAEPYDMTIFQDYGTNAPVATAEDRFSTFAVDVDTGSYTIGRRFISDGFLPQPESVRVEEYVNFFDQRYRPPADAAFAIDLEGAPTPFVYDDDFYLLRVGIQGYEVDVEDRPPANLTFVIDVSGSMDREDRLETVKDALALLVGQLEPSDQVGIVVYGSEARVVLEPTAVEDDDFILDAIEELRPDGSTNAEAGLQLGYDMANRAWTRNAINRVILLSDGVANVGETGPEAILEEIGRQADDIQLVTVGFGMGNYNDVLMEQLANQGDGFYAYVDTLDEAERIFVDGLSGTLLTIAKDAKIQVEFNPDVVSEYRLIGFENRDVADKDFRNDDIDAGEIGAGHSVTALYEIELHDDVRSRDGVATAFLRWEDPDTGEVIEIDEEITAGELAGRYSQASDTFQLASAVAAYAELLRDSRWSRHYDIWDVQAEVERIASGALRTDTDVAEFADIVDHAARLMA